MKSKIYWTKSERVILFESLLAVFSKKPLLDKRAAIVSAQTALPKHRRRKITANLAWIERDFVESARSQVTRQPAPIGNATPTAAALKPPHKDEHIDSMLNQIADMMSNKILQRIQANLGAALNAPEASLGVSGQK